MKKAILFLLAALIFSVSGCKREEKNLYLPEAEGDKVYTVISGNQNGTTLHQGSGYTISVPANGYRYEKDYDDGALEETWEKTLSDDVKLTVTTYKTSDEAAARGMFLRDNNDYIFEDLTGSPVCGKERDGDMLCFEVHAAEDKVFIVSWEYPARADKGIKAELSEIAKTFMLIK